MTATRVEQALTDAIPFTTVVTREDIERSQQPDVVSLLQREAGVQFSQSGSRGHTSSIFLRGAPARQVLVLVDGVPLNKQDASGALSLEHLMLDAVERIEIVRGNVSALYGSNAIGGVVQIFTRRAQGKPGATIELEAGARGSTRATVSAQARIGRNALAAGITRQHTDGQSAQDPSRIENANPDKDAYRNTSAWASLVHELAAGHTLSLRLQDADGRFGYDLGGSFADPADVHLGRTRVRTVAAVADHRLSDRWRTVLTLAQSRDLQTNDVRGAFAYLDRYVSRTRLIGWANHIALSDDWHLTAGLERQRHAVDVDDGFGGLYARDRHADAAYAGLTGKLGAHGLQLNLRHDRVQGTGRETTGLLGWSYQWHPHWKAVATVSNAFNVAPLGYLYAPFFGNPDLRPERAQSLEAGVQYHAGAQWGRVTLFQSRVRDEFEYDFVSYRFENVARTRNRGLELASGGRLRGIDWRANLTLQDPVDVATGEQRLRRAKVFAAAGLTVPVGAWRLAADWRYNGRRPDSLGYSLPAYHVVDLSARYAVSRTVDVFARLDNVFDRAHETVYGYPQPGRSLFVGLRWRPTF